MPRECLAHIDAFIVKVPELSRAWYQYKLYQFESLFQLACYNKLAEHVTPWINTKNLPLKFSVNLYIYYAKSIQEYQPDKSKEYLEKAIVLLQAEKETSEHPLLLVQIANTLNSLGRFRQGYALLKPLEKKYRNRAMPKFKHELFENLGHFAYRLNMLTDHLRYRLLALRWAKELNNDIQESIALYNVARAYQMLKNYEQAFHYYSLSEKGQVMGDSDQNMVWYRRAEMALAMGNTAKAKTYFAKVDRLIEVESYQKIFADFEMQLKQAKQVSVKAED